MKQIEHVLLFMTFLIIIIIVTYEGNEHLYSYFIVIFSS